MNNIKLFENKKVRSVWNEADQKWYFSIQDVIELLTGSADVKQYVKKLKNRDPELNSNWGTICTLVEMKAEDGKTRKIQASNVEQLLRIIQSIPSPKAEPFKRWLAKVGGKIAGDARKKLEIESGKKVVTNDNYLEEPEKIKKIKETVEDYEDLRDLREAKESSKGEKAVPLNKVIKSLKL
jgi:prophage antirepressor-like protein